jgi:hypothetical protein
MIPDFTKVMLPMRAEAGKMLVLVLPDQTIRPVSDTWMRNEADEFAGLRALESETGGTLVYLDAFPVEGVPHHELPRYDIASGQFLSPHPDLVRAEWVRQAGVALKETDWKPGRVFEEGGSLNPDWTRWRNIVRAILQGEADGPLPDEPPYRGGANVHAGPEDHPTPPGMVDILSEHGLNIGDSYERVNDVLVKRYADAMGNSEYARGNADGMHGGRSVIEWLDAGERANSGIKWNRGRKVETI